MLKATAKKRSVTQITAKRTSTHEMDEFRANRIRFRLYNDFAYLNTSIIGCPSYFLSHVLVLNFLIYLGVLPKSLIPPLIVDPLF